MSTSTASAGTSYRCPPSSSSSITPSKEKIENDIPCMFWPNCETKVDNDVFCCPDEIGDYCYYKQCRRPPLKNDSLPCCVFHLVPFFGTMRNRLIEIQKENTRIEKENVELRNKITSLKEVNAKQADRIRNLSIAKTSAEQVANNAQVALENRDQKISDLQTRCVELEKYQKLIMQISDITDNNKTATSPIFKKRRQLKRRRSNVIVSDDESDDFLTKTPITN